MSSPLRRTRQPVSDDWLMPNTSPEKVALREDKLKLLKILARRITAAVGVSRSAAENRMSPMLSIP